MTSPDAQIAIFVAGGAGAALFVIQSLCWFLLRTKRLGLPRWKRLSKLFLLLGLALALIGVIVLLLRNAELQPGAVLALGAGALNGFIAAFHQRTIAWLERHPR